MSQPGDPTRFPVQAGDVLVIEVTRAIGLRGRRPERFAGSVEGTAHVNLRYIVEGLPPPLAPASAWGRLISPRADSDMSRTSAFRLH